MGSAPRRGWADPLDLPTEGSASAGVGQIHTHPTGMLSCYDVSSIECRHSRHKQFRHKLSFRKNLCTRTGMFFIRLSWQLRSPLAGATALFRLKSPSRYRVWVPSNFWKNF